MSKWIRTEERLPTDSEELLFNVPGCYGVEKGRRYDRKWVSDRTSSYGDRIDWTDGEVNYWMPLPEPPND